MRRFFCALLSAFVLSVYGGVCAAPTPKQLFESFGESADIAFSDMDSYEWASEAVYSLAEEGIISGVGEGLFMPGRSVSRIEFIKMITTACSLLDSGAVSEYEDVPSSHWGYIYASSAKQSSLLSIYPSEFLGAGEPISREDMAYISSAALEAALCSPKADGGGLFADDAEIAEYAREAVYLLKSAGVINGLGENRFNPKGTATRAEAAKIIYSVSNIMKQGYLEGVDKVQ